MGYSTISNQGVLGFSLTLACALVTGGCGGSRAEHVEITTTSSAKGVSFEWTGGPMHHILVQHCDDSACKGRSGEECSYDGDTTWKVDPKAFEDDLPAPSIESPTLYGVAPPAVEEEFVEALVPGKPYVVTAHRYERCDDRPADVCFAEVLAGCGYFDAPNAP